MNRNFKIRNENNHWNEKFSECFEYWVDINGKIPVDRKIAEEIT